MKNAPNREYCSFNTSVVCLLHFKFDSQGSGDFFIYFFFEEQTLSLEKQYFLPLSSTISARVTTDRPKTSCQCRPRAPKRQFVVPKRQNGPLVIKWSTVLV